MSKPSLACIPDFNSMFNLFHDKLNSSEAEIFKYIMVSLKGTENPHVVRRFVHYLKEEFHRYENENSDCYVCHNDPKTRTICSRCEATSQEYQKELEQLKTQNNELRNEVDDLERWLLDRDQVSPMKLLSVLKKAKQALESCQNPIICESDKIRAQEYNDILVSDVLEKINEII